MAATRLGVGGPGAAYPEFIAKGPVSQPDSYPRPAMGALTRLALGGSGGAYLPFEPKGVIVPTQGFVRTTARRTSRFTSRRI